MDQVDYAEEDGESIQGVRSGERVVVVVQLTAMNAKMMVSFAMDAERAKQSHASATWIGGGARYGRIRFNRMCAYRIRLSV